jgi:hypothetical protein
MSTDIMKLKGTLSYKKQSGLGVELLDNVQVRFETLDDEMCRVYFWQAGAEIPIPDNIELLKATVGNPAVPNIGNSYIINWIHSYVVTQNGVTVVDIGQQKQQYVRGLQGLQSGIVVDGVMIQQTEEEVRPFL